MGLWVGLNPNLTHPVPTSTYCLPVLTCYPTHPFATSILVSYTNIFFMACACANYKIKYIKGTKEVKSRWANVLRSTIQ